MVNDGATSTSLQICLDDQWLTLDSSLRVASEEFPVVNLQLDGDGVGISVEWDAPTTDEMVLGYDVVCSMDISTGMLTISLSVNGESPSMPIFLSLAVPGTYRCCVTANVQGNTGVRFSSQTCQTTTTTTSQFTSTPTPCPPTASCEDPCPIITLVMGVLAGVFLLALLIVGMALVIFLCSASNRNKGIYEANNFSEMEMKV